MTMAEHGQRQQKHPPSTPHEALHPVHTSPLDRGRLPEQARFFSSGLGGVWPLIHSDVTVLHHRRNKGALWLPYTPSPSPPNYSGLLGGLSSINPTHPHEAQSLMWGLRGPFPHATAMAVTVIVCVL